MECLINRKVLSVALLRMSCGIVDDTPDSVAGESGFNSRLGGRLFIVPPVPLHTVKASGNGSVALLILNFGTRSVGPGRFTPGTRSPVQEAGFVPYAVWTVFFLGRGKTFNLVLNG